MRSVERPDSFTSRAMLPASPCVELETCLGQTRAQRLVRFERNRHARLARTAPHDVASRTRPQRKLERSEQHRLAGTGLAGENRRAVGKLHVSAGDQTVIFDLEPAQHDRLLSGGDL